jgi:hypothetical protein
MREFFSANGFREMIIRYIAKPVSSLLQDHFYLELDPNKTEALLRPGFSLGIFGAFTKVEDVPLSIPQQGYYSELWKDYPHEDSRFSRRTSVPLLPRSWKIAIGSSLGLRTLRTMSRARLIRL